ncbi:Cld1p [Sugiyamaella lignohabitans]|uniref:Cld1p n=1 Tax=Sugiyamaella lignohabitans TaxID=796027 RepID=A0A167DXV0_9ASCO|nr:Cld1p [Sugiyamaella lignohabitans]ANB13425.1 Cld1p [Sugiyamaella lignohabitans]
MLSTSRSGGRAWIIFRLTKNHATNNVRHYSSPSYNGEKGSVTDNEAQSLTSSDSNDSEILKMKTPAATVHEKLDRMVNSMKTTVVTSTASGNDILGTPASSTVSPRVRDYKPPTPPTGVPLSKLLSNVFPLSYGESYKQWLERKDLETAEHQVLSLLPFFPASDGIRQAESLQVPISNGNFINEFQISRSNENVKHELVVLHGYGAGLGFFYKNFEEMSSRAGWRVHALDLLGYGRSSRPKFDIWVKDPVQGVLAAEKFFMDALEEWRVKKGIEKFTLIAHSMGAYIGLSYAAKYRNRVNRMMLVSPAGVPRSIYSIPSSKLPDCVESPTPRGGQNVVPGWFKYLWECHWSPFSLVRNTGPLGPRFVSGWTSRRFARLPPEESEALHKYTYAIFNAPGSGEYALNYLLAPGAHGRWPLAERAHTIPCASTWVYGDHDWMDINGGLEAARRIRATGGEADVISVRNSGHHIYLDNYHMFNRHVSDFLEEAEKPGTH